MKMEIGKLGIIDTIEVKSTYLITERLWACLERKGTNNSNFRGNVNTSL